MNQAQVITIPEEGTNGKVQKSSHVKLKKFLIRRIPICGWLPKCTPTSLFHDVVAGFTVALTEIPQSIAYADIAGLPLQFGLYSSFMGSFMYAIFGGCQAVNMGATSLMALMIQQHVVALGPIASIAMSFFAGIIILAAGLFRLGFIVDFFSYPIIAGFTSAAALTIASAQIGNFLGIPGQSDGFLEAWEVVIKNIKSFSQWDGLLGLVSLVSLLVLKGLSSFSMIKENDNQAKIVWKRILFFVSIARNAIVVIIASILAYSFDKEGFHPFRLTKKVEPGLPPIQFPLNFNKTNLTIGDLVDEYKVSIGFLPLIAILESIAVAKVFSQGKLLDASQEMIALGIANFMGSFVGSMPVTSSFSRTAVNNASGAKTNIAGVVTGSIILITLSFLTTTFVYIPKATLAAVIICAMFYIFEFEAFITLWKVKRIDLIPFLVTFLSCLLISLEYGILIGIFTNLIFIIYSIARPKIFFKKQKLNNDSDEVLMITPKTTIHFLAAEFFRSSIVKYADEEPIIIIDGKKIGNMDITVAKSIAATINELEKSNKKIMFVNFKESVKNVFLNLDEKLMDNFKLGKLENLIEDS